MSSKFALQKGTALQSLEWSQNLRQYLHPNDPIKIPTIPTVLSKISTRLELVCCFLTFRNCIPRPDHP